VWRNIPARRSSQNEAECRWTFYRYRRKAAAANLKQSIPHTMPLNLFVTGTDTDVGKTVLTVLLTRTLRARGTNVLAVKPFCSGGRDDAKTLWATQKQGLRGEDGGSILSLDAINPWHFREPLTPLLAARRVGSAVSCGQVTAFLMDSGLGREVLIIEGSGGLLSPLGEGCDARGLISRLKAVPIVVAANRLGALNHVLLTWEALSPAARKAAQLVLMEPSRPGVVARTNREMLAERLGPERVHRMPRLASGFVARMAWGRIPESAVLVVEQLVAAVTG
jgi:dethiobiotin synthetase